MKKFIVKHKTDVFTASMTDTFLLTVSIKIIMNTIILNYDL